MTYLQSLANLEKKESNILLIDFSFKFKYLFHNSSKKSCACWIWKLPSGTWSWTFCRWECGPSGSSTWSPGPSHWTPVWPRAVCSIYCNLPCWLLTVLKSKAQIVSSLLLKPQLWFNDESAYKGKAEQLAKWCIDNIFSSSWLREDAHETKSSVRRVKSSKFLDANITEEFSWALNFTYLAKKAQQWL